MADLVVASKVKELIKGRGMNTSSDLADALSAKVDTLLQDAVARAKSNDRKTVRSGDL